MFISPRHNQALLYIIVPFYFTDKSTEDGVYEVYIGNLASDVIDVSLLSLFVLMEGIDQKLYHTSL